MAAVKEKVGQMACLCCGHALMVRKTATGTLTGACDGCDISMFAKPGTRAYRHWMANTKPLPDDEPKEPSQEPASKPPKPEPAPVPAPLPAAAPAPVPAAKKKAGVFDFLGA